MHQVNMLFKRWDSLKDSGDKTSVKELETKIGELLQDVMDNVDQLADTITISQTDNLFNLTASELKSRKKFVSGIRKQNNHITKAIKEAVNRRKLLARDISRSPKSGLSVAAKDEKIIQQQILQEQEEILDNFHQKVTVISHYAIDIGQEIDRHNE
eukprot:TRINITY_DN2962_c0_g6_i4.p1 TRINITY_DN2962_c0_g6~~TRINITY_DN2962_c0_g6_i4.p1  ORF type:complete len:156 (+),score=32.26 TRINITY_DN2962_c0_g6_i4:150-617(+)